MNKYKIFIRKWWKDDPKWPGGLAPDPNARKTTVAYASSVEEARRICKEWNDDHNPGKYGRKAEFTSM